MDFLINVDAQSIFIRFQIHHFQFILNIRLQNEQHELVGGEFQEIEQHVQTFHYFEERSLFVNPLGEKFNDEKLISVFGGKFTNF